VIFYAKNSILFIKDVINMETIDVFFYKLSRKFIVFWDLFKTYFNDSTRDEKILFIALAVIVLLFLLVVFKIMQRSYFNRRVKKLGFVNVVHINTANEVYEKNLFIRVFFFFWNFNKLVIVEAKPLALLDAITPEPALEPTDELAEEIQEIEELHEEQEPPVEPAPTTIPTDVEALVEKRFAELAKRLEESLMNRFSTLPAKEIKVKEDVVLEPVKEIVVEPTEEPLESPKEVVEAIKEVTEYIEEAKEEPKETVPEKPKEIEEPDPFFDKEVDKKYIVCKHPISGWQIKKEGSKRASRLFNTKKQAIAHATKSKFDFTIE